MYNWIESTFNVSGGVTQVIAAILALIVVLLLFSIFVFVLKRLTGANQPQNRSRQPRIAVMDSTSVDARRQLVLIRRDNVEHLLLVGGPSDLVVEQNIVRNAPVAAQRPAVTSAPASAGSGTMKMPTAPGPDIPPRPDEIARQPVAAMLRPEPIPAVPLKARAEASIRPNPKTAAASALVRPVSPLKNEDKTAPVVAPVSPPVTKPAQEAAKPVEDTDTGTRPDRAADLLRAATQNGFNRSTSAVQGAQEEATGDTTAGAAPKTKEEPVIGSASKVKEEPAFNPAPEPETPSIAAESHEGASAPLKSLGRSIAARERSSQMAHTITPPSSGPAARAKTALLNPVQAPSERDDTGFVFKEPIPADAEEASAGPAGSADNTDAVQTGDMNSDEEKLKFSDLFDTREKFDWIEDEPAQTVEAETVSGTDPASDNAPAATAAATSDEVSSASGREIKLDLELDDLIDGEAPEPASATASEGMSVAPTMPQQEPEVQSAGSAPQTTRQSASLDIVPRAEPAAAQATKGLGDKNPIEDEMAKILFELGGQQNR